MYNIIKNIFIKFFLLFFIIAIILDEVNHKEDINNLKDYFGQSICKILYFTINYDCSLKLFTNNDFYEDIKEINSNINLLIDIKISKIESIFLLLGIYINFNIFQKSLYINYNFYIQLKKKEITFNILVNLLSKCHY